MHDFKKLFPDAEFVCVAHTDTWHECRLNGITSSQAASLYGCGFQTRLDVWAQKTGAIPPEDIGKNEYVRWGNLLEPVIAAEYQKRTGSTILKAPGLFKNKKHPLLLSTPDYIIMGDDRGPGILEIKTTSAWNKSGWSRDCPIAYEVQINHQMVTMGAEWGVLCCLVGGQEMVAVDKQMDVPFGNAMIEDIEGFWEKNVLGGERPAAECARSGETLFKLYPRDDGKIITPTAGLNRLIAIDLGVSEKMETIKKLTKEVKVGKAKIKDAIGDNLGVALPGATWTWSSYSYPEKKVPEHTQPSKNVRILRRKAAK